MMTLTELLIANADEATYARGAAYWRQGHVRSAKWQKRGRDGPVLISRVTGSSGYYDQVIRIDFAKEDIDGECSCPVGYNCKHVVAALLEANAGMNIDATPPETPPSFDANEFTLSNESAGAARTRKLAAQLANRSVP